MKIAHLSIWLWSALILIAQCGAPQVQGGPTLNLTSEVYFDKVHGAWQATMFANHTGLVHEGKYLTKPSSATSIEFLRPQQWSTDDDTAVEWVNLHILESHGLDPSYEEIRLEWIEHLNHDIWVSTRRARDLMDEGVVPPATGSPELNPDGVWSLDAQLQTELFGLLAPGMPARAAQQATHFARITNSGFAVEASAFYATLYASAFFEADVPHLIAHVRSRWPADAEVSQIVDAVVAWHQQYPDNWRETRSLIRDAYDTDLHWWAARVNFASTLMALLYGQGDLLETVTIANLAGWDADNNATTSGGLLGIIVGYDNLPDLVRNATDRYYNEDVTGDLPRYDSVVNIARRTQRLAERQIEAARGRVNRGMYNIVPGP